MRKMLILLSVLTAALLCGCGQNSADASKSPSLTSVSVSTPEPPPPPPDTVYTIDRSNIPEEVNGTVATLASERRVHDAGNLRPGAG